MLGEVPGIRYGLWCLFLFLWVGDHLERLYGVEVQAATLDLPSVSVLALPLEDTPSLLWHTWWFIL